MSQKELRVESLRLMSDDAETCFFVTNPSRIYLDCFVNLSDIYFCFFFFFVIIYYILFYVSVSINEFFILFQM